MRKNRIRLAVAAALFVLVLVAFAWFQATSGKGAHKSLEAIRAEGLPISAIELNAWYQAPPPEQNRALLLMEANSEIVSAPSDLAISDDGDISPELDKKIRAHLGKNAGALKKLHRASQLPGSRFQVDFSKGFATPLPHLAPTRSIVQVLTLDALYQAHTGNSEAAVRSLKTALAVGDAIRTEPLFVSQLVGVACVAMTISTLEVVLTQTQLDEAELAALSNALAETEAKGLANLTRGLAGDRAVGISTFNSSFQEFQAMSGAPGGGNWARALAFQAYRASGLRDRDLSCYLELTGLSIRAARAGFPEALDYVAQAQAMMQRRLSSGFGRFAIFTRMMLPSMQNALRKEATLTAQLRCALAALAIERFRLEKNGKLPENLSELAPEYIHKIPANPFDGTPLRYERLPNRGYRVWSVAASAGQKQTIRTARDVSFEVRR